ncbi:MAG TPA: Gfo/Idh/MocA family oxidoreductase [Pirellulales bacterium]|jgi:predicted dehydrogenase|nr:Gfo/Idh/MocA family oxidoreductase [Pirellulales bacterium]
MNSLTPEERSLGKENFNSAIGSELTRREFLMGTVAVGVVSGAGLGAMYFKYTKVDKPLRIGFLGTGDEGGVLLGSLTPDYIEVAAIADIRPYNVHRAFHGDCSSPNAMKVRAGLLSKYGWDSEDVARKNVKVYSNYADLIADKDKLGIEAVIIALPLHLHAPAAILAMNSGLHVLTEKLMGHSVANCKEMARVSQQTGKLLATGHQRHYSILYDNAVDTIRRGLIGEVHCIRAQWHRGNLPGHDSWQPPLPSDPHLASELKDLQNQLKTGKTKDGAPLSAKDLEQLGKRLDQTAAQIADITEDDAKKYGYNDTQLPNGYSRSAQEELIRWRLWERTGGGLMAELGSHQLDASGIFVSAMGPEGGKALPLTVQAVGGRSLFPMDRECEDHVYCMYEFPAPGYFQEGSKTEVKDPNRKIGVTYSSINGNGFGDYGEVVMGTKGTLILDREQEVMLYKGSDTKTSIGVAKAKDGAPTLDTTASGGAAAAVGKLALGEGPPSRGYTEEIEHWAWCIRHPDPMNLPKCHPKVALGDAVIALTTNVAIRNPTEKSRIEFQHDWFDIDNDATPDGSKIDMAQYTT